MQYAERIQLAIANKGLSREKRWTESIAVGSASYVDKISEFLRYKRRRFVIEDNNDDSYAIWDPPVHYSRLQSKYLVKSAFLLNAKMKPKNQA